MHALILTLPRNYMIVYICVLCASSVMCARITYGELSIQVCSVVLYKYKRLKTQLLVFVLISLCCFSISDL